LYNITQQIYFIKKEDDQDLLYINMKRFDIGLLPKAVDILIK